MTRQTSIEAYHQIIENGLLGKRQFQVYEILYLHGPLTYNEVYEKIKSLNGGGWMGINSSRLSELRNSGAIDEVGTKRDPFSGMEVILWDVTDKIPLKPEKKKSKDQVIAELREENAKLRRQLNGELF